MDDDDGEEWGEEQAYFIDCTCNHEPNEHGWGSCDIECCPCEGGREE